MPTLDGMGASSALPSSASEPKYLLEAKALYELLTDGADKLGYHVQRGAAVRNATTRRLLPSSYTDSWRPARERHPDGTETDRTLNPYVLRQHLLGKYDVAWQFPSWTSLVVFDIDRSKLPNANPDADVTRQSELFGDLVDLDAVFAANDARDSVLAALWRAFEFGKDKLPVILRTPGAGYHVYLPVSRGAEAAERTWPAGWLRELVEHKLNQHGLALRPGTLELFPAGTRLRVPCGRRMALMEPGQPELADDLQLRMVGAKWRTRFDARTGTSRTVLERDIRKLARRFVSSITAARRPLQEWLGLSANPWHATWGPWGARPKSGRAEKKGGVISGASAPSQHNEDVKWALGALASGLSRPGRSSGWLLYGSAFSSRIRDLTQIGIDEPGLRHDAALKLTWHWGLRRALPKEDTLARLRGWLEAFGHNSTTRSHSPRKFIAETLREASHYFDRHILPCLAAGRTPRGVDVALPALGDRDLELVREIPLEIKSEIEMILRHLKSCADDSGRVPHPVNLSAQILSTLCGERRLLREVDGVLRRRRATVVAIEELQRLGILALHTNYSTGRHGRLYTCWYRFGSGALPKAESDGGLRVLAERAIEEGRLQVLSTGAGQPTVRLVDTERPQERPALPWWLRMYERRAFTPAEFFEADARRVIPGPFRHVFARQPSTSDPPSPGSGPGGPTPREPEGSTSLSTAGVVAGIAIVENDNSANSSDDERKATGRATPPVAVPRPAAIERGRLAALPAPDAVDSLSTAIAGAWKAWILWSDRRRQGE